MLFLTKSDYEKMLAHCKEGLPNEACGLIGGVVEGEKQYVSDQSIILQSSSQ